MKQLVYLLALSGCMAPVGYAAAADLDDGADIVILSVQKRAPDSTPVLRSVPATGVRTDTDVASARGTVADPGPVTAASPKPAAPTDKT